MIQRRSWECFRFPCDNSPFDRGGGERPLGVTIHIPDPLIDAGEAQALAVLREVVQLDSITFADSAADSPRLIEVNPADRQLPGGACPVTSRGIDGTARITGIRRPAQWAYAVSRALQ